MFSITARSGVNKMDGTRQKGRYLSDSTGAQASARIHWLRAIGNDPRPEAQPASAYGKHQGMDFALALDLFV